MIEALTVRRATLNDLDAVLRVYNEGIEDRIATLETDPKSHGVLVAVDGDAVVGSASLKPKARGEVAIVGVPARFSSLVGLLG